MYGNARWQGGFAAIRVVTGPHAQERISQEVQVFRALSRLKGKGVPELLGAGPLRDGKNQFSAARFVEVWSVVLQSPAS